MSRREILTAVGVGSTIGIGTNVVSNSSLKQKVANKSKPNSIKVSLFQTDIVAQKNKDEKNDEMHTLKECKEYLKRELQKVSSNTNFTVEVNISTPNIPENKVTGEDSFQKWQKYFENKIKEESSRDSNILLCDHYNSTDSGKGELPCSCRGRNTVGIVYNTPVLTDYNSGLRDRKRMYESDKKLITVLHEVGHNIGLTHDMGYLWLNESGNRIYVTPMLSSYSHNDEYIDTENFFGQNIIDPRQETAVVIPVKELNPKITHNNITYEW